MKAKKTASKTVKVTPATDFRGLLKELADAHSATLDQMGINHPPHNDAITKARKAIKEL